MNISSGLKHFSLTIVAALVVSLTGSAIPAQSPTSGPKQEPLEIPKPEELAEAGGQQPLPLEKRRNSEFVFSMPKHPTLGDRYVIVTDHTDSDVLEAIDRLSEYRDGLILKVPDLAELYRDFETSQRLRREISNASPKYVAIVPRAESYRENMLLHMWELLTELDDDPQLDVFPGLLAGPNSASVIGLIDRSIDFSPLDPSDLRPFLISHVPSTRELRSLQKAGILRIVFNRMGQTAPTLAIYNPMASTAPGLEGEQFWRETMIQRGQFLKEIPEAAQDAFGAANFLVMHGHGSPGNSCGVDNQAIPSPCRFRVLMTGSCFSASPILSDLPAMRQAPGGLTVEKKESLAMHAIENGTTVFFGHMRLSQGFPRLYPVLHGWMAQKTVGQTYQELLNSGISMQSPTLKSFVVDKTEATRRLPQNSLLYVIIGDPALQPLAASRKN